MILVTLAAGVSSFAQRPSQGSQVARQLVGRWKLVSLEAVRPNGEVVREWGPHPTGYLSYDASGFVSVQFERDPRAAKQSRDLTPDERRDTFESCTPTMAGSTSTTTRARSSTTSRAACDRTRSVPI